MNACSLLPTLMVVGAAVWLSTVAYFKLNPTTLSSWFTEIKRKILTTLIVGGIVAGGATAAYATYTSPETQCSAPRSSAW